MKKKTVDDYIALSLKKGIVFLDKEIPKTTTTLTKVHCKKCKHVWFSHYDRLTIKGCPTCAGNAKYTIDDYIALEKKKNIIFLNEEFPKNSKTKAPVKCKVCNYIWLASYGSLLNHSCPRCVGQARITIKDCLSLTETKNLLLFSTKVDNENMPLSCKCKICNYEFKISYAALRIKKNGCGKCSKNFPKSYLDYINLAKDKNITFLDIEANIPNNVKEKTRVKCNVCDYIWKSSYNFIKAANNCPKCIKRARIELHDYLDLEKKKNIKFLIIEDNKIPKNVSTKSEAQCDICKYIWLVTYDKLKYSNSGCPACVGSKGEMITRNILENIFKEKFPKIRPSWLINPETGFRLELDGYCQALNIAFEYQGAQHFEEIDHFKLSLKEQQKRDQIKIKLCDENNVKIIIINQFKTLAKNHLIKEMNIALKDFNVPEDVIDKAVNEVV